MQMKARIYGVKNIQYVFPRPVDTPEVHFWYVLPPQKNKKQQQQQQTNKN